MFAADVSDVGVAAVGAVGVIAAAAVPVWLNARRTRKAVGTPNGKGTVVEMLERSLENQGEFRVGMQQISTHLESVAAKQEAHSLEDHKRFRVVFDHLGIPYEMEDSQ